MPRRSQLLNEFKFPFLWRLFCLGAVGDRYAPSSIIFECFQDNCISRAISALVELIKEEFILTFVPGSTEYISLNPKRLGEVKQIGRAHV